MYKKILLWLMVFAAFSCSKEIDIPDEPGVPQTVHKTLFMYLPWSSNLLSYFQNNIADMEKAIEEHGLDNERVLVFLSTAPSKAKLFEIVYKDGQCVQQTLKEYINPAFTTAEGITGILNDVKSLSPAEVYAMTIGCHGMGWLPVETVTRTAGEKWHWQYESPYMTRYFGGTESKYQTDIATLAQGISDAGLRMEYILFDDCYMSSIEVAYDLRDVTDYLIGSTCEIMAYGMPYSRIGKYLLGDTDYEAVCEEFYNFYSTYSMPCGTIGVTNCAELDNMAAVMKEINSRYTFSTALLPYLQTLDGYTPTIFYDYGQYVALLCQDENLWSRYLQTLERLVPYKACTETYYTAVGGGRRIPITYYSGITTSDPSINPTASASKRNTSWYQATH